MPPPIPTTSNQDLQEDLQRLRSCLESQLTLMQNSLGIHHKGNNETEQPHGKSQYISKKSAIFFWGERTV